MVSCVWLSTAQDHGATNSVAFNHMPAEKKMNIDATAVVAKVDAGTGFG
jgi:hypothetical protein